SRGLVAYVAAGGPTIMKSLYTAGAVAPVTVDWGEILQAPRDALPPHADPRAAGSARGQAFAFRSLSRDQQLRVWLDSLPPALVSAPRIDWGRLPSRIMTCLLYGRRKNDPERAQLALAAGVAVTNGVLATTVYNHVMAMVFLWERLRATYQLERVGDLTYEQWIHFGSQTQLMRRHAGAIGV